MFGLLFSIDKLENKWCFWEHQKGDNQNYTNQMHQLGTFNTVEDFWCYKNNLPNPSDIFFTQTGGEKRFTDRGAVDAYSLFKTNIRPEWEDPNNASGCELFCRTGMTPEDLDKKWELLLLGTVGETIDPADEICGVRVVDKSRGSNPIYRLEVWMRNQDEKITTTIRENISKCLESKIVCELRRHDEMSNAPPRRQNLRPRGKNFQR